MMVDHSQSELPQLDKQVMDIVSWATDGAIQAEYDAQFEMLHGIDQAATNKIMKLFEDFLEARNGRP